MDTGAQRRAVRMREEKYVVVERRKTILYAVKSSYDQWKQGKE